MNFEDQKKQIEQIDEHKNQNLGDDQNLIIAKRREGNQIIDILKDLFYGIGKTLYQIFREYGFGEKVDIKQFKQIVSFYSKNSISEEDVE